MKKCNWCNGNGETMPTQGDYITPDKCWSCRGTGLNALKLDKEELSILDHTIHRATGGFYCGDSKEMKNLVKVGYMASAGKKSFVPDEYFRITPQGKDAFNKLIAR